MKRKTRELLKRISKGPATKKLLDEVSRVLQRAVETQQFEDADYLRNAQRHLQAGVIAVDNLRKYGISTVVQECDIEIPEKATVLRVTITRRIGRKKTVSVVALPTRGSLDWAMRGMRIVLGKDVTVPGPIDLPKAPVLP